MNKILQIIVFLILAININAEIRNEEIIENISRFLSSSELEVDIGDYLMDKVNDRSSYYVILLSDFFEICDNGIESPVYYDSLIIAEILDEKNNVASVEVSSWIIDVIRGNKVKILSYHSVCALENDGFRLVDDPIVTRLISNNNVLWARFIFLDEDVERLFMTNSYLNDYGENSPTARCETFNQLYCLFKIVESINFENIRAVMASDYSDSLDDR